jgi:hypothetical protein
MRTSHSDLNLVFSDCRKLKDMYAHAASKQPYHGIRYQTLKPRSALRIGNLTSETKSVTVETKSVTVFKGAVVALSPASF